MGGYTGASTEAIDIRLSKLICPTPIATTAWLWDDLAGRIADPASGCRIDSDYPIDPAPVLAM